MKMTKFLAGIALTGMLVMHISCTKEEIAKQDAEKIVTLTVTTMSGMDDGVKTRTNIVDDGTTPKVTWAEGDVLYVANETNFKNIDFSELKLVSGAGTSTAVFSGSVKKNSESESLYAFYGNKSEVVKHNKGLGVQVDLTSFPICNELSQLSSSDFLFGKMSQLENGNYTVQMKRAGILLKFEMTGLPEGAEIESITMASSNNLFRSHFIYFVGGSKDNKIESSTNNTLKWKALDGFYVSSEETVGYVMMAGPKSGSLGDITITVKMTDGREYTVVKTGFSSVSAGSARRILLDFSNQ